MKNFLLFIFTLTFVFISCTKTSPNGKLLEKADSLLIKEKYDSAFSILKSINEKGLDKEEEAYYNLLKTQTLYCLYIPATSDSAINNSIKIYEKNGDKAKLAAAYYYKGAILYSDLKKTNEAVVFTKKAENLAKEINDLSLCGKIYNNLASINSKSGNINTALHYSKLALANSYKTGDNAITCIALDRISYIFNTKDMPDSCLFYTKKMIKYIKYLRKEEKPGFLTNAGSAFLNNGEAEKALHYIRLSLSIKPTPHAYYLYGNLLIEQGKDAEAWALWNKALDTENLTLKADVMQWMADYKKEKGEYKEASILADNINMLKDSLKRTQNAETVMHIQKNIEKDETIQKTFIYTRTMKITAAALLIILIIFGIYHARKICRARNAINHNKKIMDKYTRDLEELTKSNKTNEHEINRLNRKIEDLRDRNGKILGHGQKLWEELTAGGTIARWHKADIEAVMEYIRAKRPDTLGDMEKQYRKLTPNSMLYLLLKAEGMDDETTRHAMNMSTGALRTMKYRLKRNGHAM